MKSTKHIGIKKAGFKSDKLDANNVNALANLCNKIETAEGIKLMATNDDDIVDVYVNVVGDEIEIFMYDVDEAPNTEHASTLRKKIPTDAEIQAIKGIINSL